MLELKTDTWHYRLYSKYNIFTNNWYGQCKNTTLCKYITNVLVGIIGASLTAAVGTIAAILVVEGPLRLWEYFLLGNWYPILVEDPFVGVFSLALWLVVFLIATVIGIFYFCLELSERGYFDSFKLDPNKEPGFFRLLVRRMKDAHDNVCTPVKIVR